MGEGELHLTNLCVENELCASKVSCPSDERLKKNIVPFKSGLHTILGLNPIFFNYKENSGLNAEKTNVGIIAQELKNLEPELVTNREINNGEYLSVNDELLPLPFRFDYTQYFE